MSFYPRLFEEAKSKNTDILRTLAEKFPLKYGYDTGKRLENKNKISVDELQKDFTDVVKQFNGNIVDIVYPGEKGSISGKFPTFIFILDEKEYKFKFAGVSAGKQMTQTPTIFKEGLVVYFLQSKKEYEPFRKTDVKGKDASYTQILTDIIEEIESYGETGIKGLNKKDSDYIIRILKQEIQKYNLKFINGVFTALSIAKRIKQTKFANWEVYRDDFFNKIKAQAAKGIGFAANAVDKWNPMDIMLLKPGTQPDLLKQWEAADKKETEQLKLGDYNNIFVDSLDTDNPNSIALGISLKEKTAQGGKGKSYIQRIEKISDRYNLTKDEQKWPAEKLMEEIIKQRKRIPELISKLDEAEFFNYHSDGEVTGFNIPDAAKAKYGSLKLLLYLLEKVPENNMFINLAAYSLSLGQNPTFFKFQGDPTGDPSKVHVYKFEQLGGVSLYNKAHEDFDGKIHIIDNNNNAGVDIRYLIVAGSILYNVIITIRSNQGTRVEKTIQVNIEVQQLKDIEDLTENKKEDMFYPRLFEKFTQKSDPVKDMGIGQTEAEIILQKAIELSGDTVIFRKLSAQESSERRGQKYELSHSIPMSQWDWQEIKNAIGAKRFPRKYTEKVYDQRSYSHFTELGYLKLFKDVYGEDWYYDDVDLVQEDRTIVNVFKHVGIKFKDLVKLVEKSPNLKRKSKR